MEQLLLIIAIIYIVYSLLASAIYYNAITLHSRSQKALNHLLIWLLPFVWALYLKKTTPEFDETFNVRDYSIDYSEWGVGENKREAYFAEREFESVYSAFDTSVEA